jgi:hypothetical protein
MALGKYARRLAGTGDLACLATLPDGSVREFTSRDGLSLADLRPGDSVSIQAEGEGKLWAFWFAEGVPMRGQAAEEDSGLVVRRTFLDMQGRQVQPNGLRQGELYTVKLTAASGRPVENLVISDLLPAGLEIEDPGIGGSARLGTEEAHTGWAVQHVERRDDRMLIFGDLLGSRGEYTYVVRAVTAGRFALPAVEAACMYDPGVYSVHGAGTVEVER